MTRHPNFHSTESWFFFSSLCSFPFFFSLWLWELSRFFGFFLRARKFASAQARHGNPISINPHRKNDDQWWARALLLIRHHYYNIIWNLWIRTKAFPLPSTWIDLKNTHSQREWMAWTKRAKEKKNENILIEQWTRKIRIEGNQEEVGFRYFQTFFSRLRLVHCMELSRRLFVGL